MQRKSGQICWAVPLTAAGLAASAAIAEGIEMPRGWRLWPHVKTLVLTEGHPFCADFGGIHHLYANATALDGHGEMSFADGPVIVFDLFEALEGEGTLAEGARKVTAFMVKDAAAFADAGGWGFEAFAQGDPGRPVVGDKAKEACFSCHEQVADRDYVFSDFRD